MNEEMNYTGMLICPICRNGCGVPLGQQMKKRIPSRSVSPEPCEACRRRYLVEQRGIMVWEGDTTDGRRHIKADARMVVLTEDAFHANFHDVDIPERRIMLADSVVMDKIFEAMERAGVKPLGEDEKPSLQQNLEPAEKAKQGDEPDGAE